MDVFDKYLTTIDNPDNRARTAEVLRWVGETFPSLSPRIAWNQPMFTDHGTYIIGFSVSKRHLAVSPERQGILQFAERIAQAGYDCSKMLFRIGWNSQVDYGLLKTIIAYNMRDKADCQTFWRR